MKIHTYEKLWLAGSMVLIVGIIATITYGSVGLGITMVGDDEGTIEPDAINDDERFGEPRVEQVGENEYEAYVVAQTFIFQPDPIEVPAGSEVTFYVTSRDVIHGLQLPGTNVNTMVIPGEIAEITVEFDESGEYGVICNEYCGDFHHNMEGALIVTPADEFDQTTLSVTAPGTVDAGEEIELTATVENGLLDDHETTVEGTIGDETFQREVTVPGQSSENVTVTVDSDDLGDGEHDWSVTVDGEDASGTVTVGPEEPDEGTDETDDGTDEPEEDGADTNESDGG